MSDILRISTLLGFSILGTSLISCTAILGDFSIAPGTPTSADSATPMEGGIPDGFDAGARDASGVSDTGSAPDVTTQSDGEADAETILLGHVVSTPQPIIAVPNRRVVIIDATGRKSPVMTDSAGAFTLRGVVPPYDALVEGDGASPAQVVLGLSTLHPRLQAYVRPASVSGQDAGASRSATINIPLSCADCAVGTVYTAQAVLRGTDPTVPVTGSISESMTLPGSLSLSVTWSGPAATNVHADILVSDTSYSHYWSAALYGQPVQGQGAVSTLATANVAPQATLGTLTVTASGAPPTGWATPCFDVWLQYPAPQGPFSIGHACGPSLVVGVPDVLGATLSTMASSRGPDRNAWMSASSPPNLPLSASTSTLVLGQPPILSTPANGGSLSGSTGKVVWSGSNPNEIYDAYISILPDGGGIDVADVWSASSPIDLARVSALGISFPPGRAGLELFASGKASGIDATFDDQTPSPPDNTMWGREDINFTFTP